MCICIQYNSPNVCDAVFDVSAWTLQKLVLPQGQCGELNYILLEILHNCELFDGFAANMWAAGELLFIMLIELPPFESWASTDNAQFFLSLSSNGSVLLV
jgi:hypothetical protein